MQLSMNAFLQNAMFSQRLISFSYWMNQQHVFKKPTDLIDPIIDFENKTSCCMSKSMGEIVICVNQKHIRHWFEPPLQPAIQIEIFYLCVVL